MIYYLIFSLFLLITPTSLLPMENEKQLYFQQLDSKTCWSNSSSETFFFIDNLATPEIRTEEIPVDIKRLIKTNFIDITQDEINCWDNHPKFNFREIWHFPITANDFSNSDKKDKEILFTLRHANRHNRPKHHAVFRIYRTLPSGDREPSKTLLLENKCYDLLVQLKKQTRTIIANNDSLALLDDTTKTIIPRKESLSILTKDSTDPMIAYDRRIERMKIGAIAGICTSLPLIAKIMQSEDYPSILNIIGIGRKTLCGITVILGIFGGLKGVGIYKSYFPFTFRDVLFENGYIERPIIPEDDL